LLPWVPAWPVEAALGRVALEDPAATAGLYYERVEQERFLERRSERLLAVLESEIRGQRGIEAKVAADALRFEDPERFQRSGEALLAGLTQARRVGDQVLVPDPYDSEGRALAVEVPPGRSLTRAAQLYFERHRRARRGLQRSRERGKQVSERRVRLERLRERYAGKTDARSVESLARDMQGESIPIALERIRSGSRNPNRTTRPRLEGVRLFTSREGDSVLVGKSGKDNHRLTFRLAAPEDFWLHALGVRGAHVVVRNDTGAARPRDGSLQEAAGAAAWFSEAREQALVDVQWTRRKYVRRIRGAPPGTVRVKRSETVRVKPRRPPDD
jgi:predicted ribosome quality control (RQC) complex YloA/Tae2 family protein